MNLIPDEVKPCGSYYCTWHHQNKVMRKYGIPDEHGSGSRDALSMKYLFDEENDYHWLPAEDRKGVWLVLDDGWDVAYGTQNNGRASRRFFGSVEPDPGKFGELGDTPLERLKALDRLAKEHGYAGLGLWIAPQVCGEIEDSPMDVSEEYWISRAKLCAEAGVRYWKVDWGYRSNDTQYRRVMTKVVKQYAPDLMIEHAYIQKPIMMPGEEETRRVFSRAAFALGDAFRTYDIMWPLPESTTLSRLHEVLEAHPKPEYGARQIPNAEYRYFIAAGLGCAVGVMDETIHAVATLRWQRIAPPFGAGETDYRFSYDEFLTDRFFFPKNAVSYLEYAGKELTETAPAVMARGCNLPAVVPVGAEKPYVCCSQNPRTGAYAIATVRRTVDPNALIIAPAHITWHIGDPDAPVGVFGYMESLTLVYLRPLKKDARFYAQNLADREAVDITDEVTVFDNYVTIPGRTMYRVGAFNYEYPNLTADRKIDDPMLVIRIIGA